MKQRTSKTMIKARKREQTWVNKFISNKADITTEIQRVIRDYFKNQYDKQPEILWEMDTYDLPNWCKKLQIN